MFYSIDALLVRCNVGAKNPAAENPTAIAAISSIVPTYIGLKRLVFLDI